MWKLWNKIRDLIRSITNNSDYYDMTIVVNFFPMKVAKYDEDDVSEGIDINKTNGLRECLICH